MIYAGSYWEIRYKLTGGSMQLASGKDGSSKPFAAMFNTPVASEVAAFENIHEYKTMKSKCGWFVCDMWSNFGSSITINGERYLGLDENGNAHFWAAELFLNKERIDKAPPKGTQKAFNKFLTQRCKTSSEAFLISTGSVFNTADLIARRNIVKTSKGGFSKFRMPGELIEANNEVTFKPDIEGKFEPITTADIDLTNREGCLLIYEQPRLVHGVVPDGAYIITVDPIGKNTSGGTSLNSVIVMKTPKHEHLIGHERIVATYHGRKSIRPLDYLHTLLMKLSKYYNAQISYENDQDGGILNYFVARNALDRLMPIPMMVTKKHMPNSKTLLREFGHSMSSERHKSIGEMYVNEWLDFRHKSKTGVDHNNEVVTEAGLRNLDLIEDEFLLESLINYNREGNFDAVLSLMGGIIQFKERYEPESVQIYDREHVSEVNQQLFDYFNERFNEDRRNTQHTEGYYNYDDWMI